MKGTSEDTAYIDELDSLAPNFTRPNTYGDFDPMCSLARRRGRAHELVVCPCGWRGKHAELRSVGWRGEGDISILRRPDGFCPDCKKRPFWMPLSEAQAAILEP